MENSDQKDLLEKPQETVVQKPKAKWPLIAAISGSAVLCVGLIAGIIAFNVSHNNVTASVEASTAAQEMSAAEGTKGISLISREGHNISDNPFEKPSQTSNNSKSDTKSDNTSITSGTDKSSKAQQQSSKQEDIWFGDNVTVMGVKVKGMTLAGAYDTLKDIVWLRREPVQITATCGGQKVVLTEDDFTYNTDLSEVLLEAYHYSRKEQDQTTYPTTVQDGVTNFTADCWLDESSIKTALNKVYDVFDEPPVDAHVVAFHPEEVEKFVYEDGHDGYMVDHSILENRTLAIVRSTTKTGTVTLTKKKKNFTVTLEDVKAQTKLIASHYTVAANVYNSNFNMGLALLSANGKILQPGEIFSFNETTGDTTCDMTHYYYNGVVGSYLPSTAIVGGKYEQQYGGGICQASTTLYICAMKAGLQAIERYAHAYPSIYCYKGLDATIDYGNLDMKFKNTQRTPIYIATYVYDYNGDGLNELMVEMYGSITTEYDEIVPTGWVDYAGSTSFSAKAAQVYFKDGKELKRVPMPSGSYDYKYDTYYSVINEMPYDTENGPYVSPTNSIPTVFSPGGCGSSAPISYGSAEQYLKSIEEAKKKAKEPSKPESSKQESSKQESSKQESSKQESSKQESSKQESSKQESSKQESSKQESSKQESSKQESSKQESSKQESSKQESSKQESSKQESSKQESSKQESSKQESSKQESSKVESSVQESSGLVSEETTQVTSE